MQNLLSSEKRTLYHWATVQFFFCTAQVRRFWHCLWLRSGLVALFLKTSECGDSWCIDCSFSPLLVKLSSVWISFAWQYSQACGHPCCLCTFSYQNSSFQSTLHLICFDTALCKQPHLSVMTPLWLTLFMEGVNVRLLDHCQVSSLLHYCGFKEQEIPGMYTVWIVINWNSNVNILIFWDTDIWLSWAVNSNHQN